jgi:Tfp pilus assembly protein PilF
MKKYFLLLIAFFGAIISFAQPEDSKTLHETAKNFMRTGDFDNAILVLTRALKQDNKNLELQKDLVMSYYLKRDYQKALDGVENMVDRADADVVTFQIAGNVYKALEEVKECDKVYKKGLKKISKKRTAV